MPYSLCVQFQQSREWAVDMNIYRDGRVQRAVLVATSRKRWTLAKRLTATQLDALRTFFTDRIGPYQEFYFYDVWETSPVFSYDATGASAIGRYAVRFEGPWRQSLNLGRHDASLALVEVS